jgi:fatty acid desaturase
LLAETTFHGTGTTYSWLIGGLGAGAVAGGLYAARSARTGVARLIKAAVGYAIAVGLVAVAPTLATAIAACVLVGVASVIFLTTGNATIQLASDPEYRGRVTPGRAGCRSRSPSRWSCRPPSWWYGSRPLRLPASPTS